MNDTPIKDLDELELEDDRSAQEPEVEFVTGAAGTGKTHLMKQRMRENANYGVLAATTGIAAVNLDAITVNSLLKYFDTDDLRDKFSSGRIERAMKDLVLGGIRRLVIDEVSMLPAEQLDILHEAASRVSTYLIPGGKGEYLPPLGLILTGDFCQLPPVDAKWAFEAECWNRFERHTTRLTKIWRQNDPGFLEALNAARRGNGPMAVELLRELGVNFAPGLDNFFDGTTIVGTNQEVERFNFARMLQVPGRSRRFSTFRWGQQRGEWKWNPQRSTGIPDNLVLKEGALVMILANDTKEFSYANGDLAEIIQFEGQDKVRLELKSLDPARNGNQVVIEPIYRRFLTNDAPPGIMEPKDEREAYRMRQVCEYMSPYFLWDEGKWVTGGIIWMPLRVAYATTVHKSQGLSLDRVQIDCRKGFFGEPNMAYVALSRVRTPEGLRVVGTPELLAKRITVAPEVVKWL